MNEQNAVPGKTEVEQQLERMLATEIFVTKERQSKIFSCIVRGALAGDEVTEKYIREREFPSPPYEPESNVVRRTIDLLRKLVPVYYSEQGRDDPVIIKIPHSEPGSKIRLRAGEAYAPVFAYNHRHPAAREVKLAEYYMKNTGLRQGLAINRHLRKALELQPEHVGAILGLMEMFCSLSIGIDTSERDRTQALRLATGMLDKANCVAPRFWRTHAARAFYLFCCGSVAGADREFEVALSLDRISTQRYRGYINFLASVGREEEAIKLSAALLEDQVDVPSAHAFHGLAYFDAGRLTEAEDSLRQALEMDPNCFEGLMGMALLHRKWGSIAESTEYTTRLRALLDDGMFETAMDAITFFVPEK